MVDYETLCDVFCPICYDSWKEWIEFYVPNKTAVVWCSSCRKIVEASCKAVPYV